MACEGFLSIPHHVGRGRRRPEASKISCGEPSGRGGLLAGVGSPWREGDGSPLMELVLSPVSLGSEKDGDPLPFGLSARPRRTSSLGRAGGVPFFLQQSPYEKPITQYFPPPKKKDLFVP